MRIKIRQINLDIYFLESNFVGVNRLFALIYLSRNNDVNLLNVRK